MLQIYPGISAQPTVPHVGIDRPPLCFTEELYGGTNRAAVLKQSMKTTKMVLGPVLTQPTIH